MRQILLALIFYLFANCSLCGQNNIISGISNSVDLNITKEPPILVMTEGSLKFKDVKGNNAIRANQKATISFEVENMGKGDAIGLVARVTQTGKVSGLTFQEEIPMGSIATNAKKTIEIPVTGGMDLSTGTATFHIKLDEETGFGLDEVALDVKTLAFENPIVKVPDFTITSDLGKTLVKKRPFDLQILVQNVGKGPAEDVKVNLVIPDDVICLSDNSKTSFNFLSSGETKTIIYNLIVNEKYRESQIPISIRLSERYGKYAEGKTISLELNQTMSAKKVVIESNVKENSVAVKEASLGVDVDKNIPSSDRQKESTYALIIGNEDYSSFQQSLSTEVNVDYAANDAIIFKEYCVKTLGIPEKQVKLISNATEGQMSQGLALINNLAKVDNGNAELIFYYSGHGLADEKTKESYLVPVDISGDNGNQGIKLDDAYKRLLEFPTKKVSVFLDACFSGQSLVARKSVRIKPKESPLTGNMVVFASSSGDETSGVFREKQHGYMTYFLLKKLQETKGEIQFLDLANYISACVKKETALKGTIQTPQVNASPELGNAWSKWKLK